MTKQYSVSPGDRFVINSGNVTVRLKISDSNGLTVEFIAIPGSKIEIVAGTSNIDITIVDLYDSGISGPIDGGTKPRGDGD